MGHVQVHHISHQICFPPLRLVIKTLYSSVAAPAPAQPTVVHKSKDLKKLKVLLTMIIFLETMAAAAASVVLSLYLPLSLTVSVVQVRLGAC